MNHQYVLMNLFYHRGRYQVHLSSNPCVTWEIVQENPYCDWDYEFMSSNPNITWDIVKDNPDKPWVFTALSIHPNIAWTTVLKNLDQYHGPFGENPNMIWKNVIDNQDIEWSIDSLMLNRFDRWNSSAKIQHVFRRWIKNVSRYACTQVLVEREFLGLILPYELCCYVTGVCMSRSVWSD